MLVKANATTKDDPVVSINANAKKRAMKNWKMLAKATATAKVSTAGP